MIAESNIVIKKAVMYPTAIAPVLMIRHTSSRNFIANHRLPIHQRYSEGVELASHPGAEAGKAIAEDAPAYFRALSNKACRSRRPCSISPPNAAILGASAIAACRVKKSSDLRSLLGVSSANFPSWMT